MTTTVRSIITKASELLHDVQNVHWTIDGLVASLSDAQLETVAIKPDTSIAVSTVLLTSGTRQSIPADGISLVDVMRNMKNEATPGRAIRIVLREVLDAANPDWHSSLPSVVAQHFTYSESTPKTFFVYPPQPASPGYVELSYVRTPAPLTIDGDIQLDDIYAPALLNYVLYRAYSKDSEYAANKSLAEAYYSAWFAGITGKAKAESTSNPNITAPATP